MNQAEKEVAPPHEAAPVSDQQPTVGSNATPVNAFQTLLTSVDRKLEWISAQIDASSSRADLAELLGLAQQLVALRKETQQ